MKRDKFTAKREAADLGNSFVEILRGIVRDVLKSELSDRPVIKPRLMNAEQAGIYIGRSPARVRQLHSEGKILKSASDGRLLFDQGDLDDYIEREKNASQKHKLAA